MTDRLALLRDRAVTGVCVGVLLGLALSTCSEPARAQVLCTDTDTMLRSLQKRYGETPVAAGVTPRGELVTLTVDEKDGSWTIVATRASGLSCAITGGEGWSQENASPDGEPT